MSLKRAAGFTLIEIMLVMVLLALSSVAVIMTMPKNQNDEAKNEAVRFYQLSQLLSEDAMLTGRDYGIDVSAHRYHFVELTQDGWQEIKEKTKYYNQVETPKAITLVYEKGGEWQKKDRLFKQDKLFSQEDLFEKDPDEKKRKPPQIVVMASGEITPFTVSFETSGEHQYWHVVATEIGDVKLLEPGQELEIKK
ncbi:type II secretion system minor pseudopilin GspH [Photobacterium damselae subsp. damselae]|uniref:Type II secretion system protein H n=1 Tax=Photobacterium damselae subsp. damselae TaxID=85581 RepID=A0AAD3WZL9_PHODD|nr:type II secretion system minor pseudopilin GspH [Photobacterium damselae]KAB1182985.1 type II secretion system protein GspH [Photobacterium damselae subsp. damselae]